MRNNPSSRNGSHLRTRLPRAIPRVIVGCVAMFVLAAATFFMRGPGYGGIAFLFVALFALISVTLPLDLVHIGKAHPLARRRMREPPAFGGWSEDEFAIWQTHLKGKDAAITILLPVVAAAIGAAVLAIEFQAVSPG